MEKSNLSARQNDDADDRGTGCLATSVLWYLVFTGFAVNYMIRLNLNIAIVSMVRYRPPVVVDDSTGRRSSECLVGSVATNTSHNNATGRNWSQLQWHEADEQPQPATSNDNLAVGGKLHKTPPTTSFPPPSTTTTRHAEVNSNRIQDDGNIGTSQTFAWDEKQQSNILGAFFWLHWCTQLPGGILANKYGTKLVFGLANFSGILCCFLTPTAAQWGHQYLIALRMLQGLLCGFAWPAMHSMTARWIPPNERSKFVTAYLGSSVGAALTYPLCGFVIDMWGFAVAFHICGLLGSIWFAAWWFLAYDSPSEHPRISCSEKNQIQSSLGDTFTNNRGPVPWCAILTSGPVLMNILAQWGGIWGLFTLMTHGPTYFKVIHDWNIRQTGLLSGLPHILRTLWAYMFSVMGDWLLRTNRLARTNVRKLAAASCTIGQGMCVLGLAFSGCDRIAAAVFLTAAVALNGSVSTGPLASIVDISPNYASIILGIINTVVAAVGFLTPLVVGYLTFESQTVGQWQKVFLIATVMMVTSGILYIIFAKSELQPWNSPNYTAINKRQSDKEMITIHNVNGKLSSKVLVLPLHDIRQEQVAMLSNKS